MKNNKVLRVDERLPILLLFYIIPNDHVHHAITLMDKINQL